MRSGNSHLPAQPSDRAVERSQKSALTRDILLWLRDKGLGWSRRAAESTGAQFVAALTEILWNVDGHFATFSGRACPIPQEFVLFSGYNQPSKSKHRRRDAKNLSAAVLDSHSNLLQSPSTGGTVSTMCILQKQGKQANPKEKEKDLHQVMSVFLFFF